MLRIYSTKMYIFVSSKNMRLNFYMDVRNISLRTLLPDHRTILLHSTTFLTAASPSDFSLQDLTDNQRWYALNETAIFFLFFVEILVLNRAVLSTQCSVRRHNNEVPIDNILGIQLLDFQSTTDTISFSSTVTCVHLRRTLAFSCFYLFRT